jgi:hypothetical protein
VLSSWIQPGYCRWLLHSGQHHQRLVRSGTVSELLATFDNTRVGLRRVGVVGKHRLASVVVGVVCGRVRAAAVGAAGALRAIPQLCVDLDHARQSGAFATGAGVPIDMRGDHGSGVVGVVSGAECRSGIPNNTQHRSCRRGDGKQLLRARAHVVLLGSNVLGNEFHICTGAGRIDIDQFDSVGCFDATVLLYAWFHVPINQNNCYPTQVHAEHQCGRLNQSINQSLNHSIKEARAPVDGVALCCSIEMNSGVFESPKFT